MKNRVLNRIRTHFGSLFLFGAAVLPGTVDAARGDDWAFQWLEIAPPSGSTLSLVHDVNNDGHILCRLVVSGSGIRGAVHRDGAWHILEVSEGHATYVTDINNEGAVVGYSGSGGSLKGRIWLWDDEEEEYELGVNLGEKLEVWSIDYGEMAGFDVDAGDPVGLVAGSSWVPLPPLPGQDATAASGINNGDSQALPLIIGLSMDTVGFPLETHPVVWAWDNVEEEFQAIEIDPTAQHTDTPFIINESYWIVGSRGDDSPYTYILWRPDGQGGWEGVESLGLTGAGQKAVGLNQHNEVVAKKTLFYEDGQGELQSFSLDSVTGIPFGAAVGEYSSSHLAYFAINDPGWIAGKTKRYVGETTTVDVVILLVPFDRNNDGTPDYREIIEDPELDGDGNWVLDSQTKMRVGMYAVTRRPHENLVQDVANMTVVRMHSNYSVLASILNDSQECATWRSALSYLGGHDNENHQGKEIVVMIRTPWPTDEDFDYIPDAQTQEAMLADLRCFVSKYCRDIDYIQFGNEIFGGPGEYYVDLGGCTGTMRELSNTCFVPACEAVFEWMQRQADAVREASALAGRPLQIITPAIYQGLVNSGWSGSIEPPFTTDADRNAFAVQCTVAFGNRNGAAVDIHLHYNNPEERSGVFTALDRLLEGNSGEQENIWDPPFAITALEWSPVPTTTWAGNNRNDLIDYTKDIPGNIETTWEQFIDGWAEDTFTDRTMEDLIDDDLAAFDGLLRHACFGRFQQGNKENPDQWDVTVVRAQHVYSGDEPWMLETNYEKLTNVAKGLAASGASYIPYSGFDPHPNEPFNGSCGCD